MTTKPSKAPVLAILGIGKDDKPHAASFSMIDQATVRKAAQAMGMPVAVATDEKSVALALKLPRGRLFATGRALVPLVKAGLYDEVLKTLTIEAPSPIVAAPSSASGNGDRKSAAAHPSQTMATDPWDAIKVGSVVLAQDASDEPGWWEAVVTSIGPDGETLTLRWRDYPKLPQEKFKRTEVSIPAPAIPNKRRSS